MMISGNHLSQARLIWALSGSVPAVVCDLWRRRIPNSVCAMLLGGGLLLGSMERGVQGLCSGLLGAITGFSIFLIFYLGGGMGGGDLKLMAAYGAFLGVHNVLLAALITAAAGAVLALSAVAAAALRGRRPGSIPYAPAITFGALAVLLAHPSGGW
ncbi:MAG: prepilin peptidase [Acidobacteriota bacterium]|nr:prepilin peptidase [Acidobacteriota bacterium]